MKGIPTARTAALVAAALLTGLTFEAQTQEPTPTPAIAEVTALGAGSPKSTICQSADTSVPCVAVPVFVKAKDTVGGNQELTVSYAVGNDLIQRVKQDFGDTTTVLLRNLETSLQSGIHDPDVEVKQACAQTLPQVRSEVPYTVSPGVVMPVRIEKKVAEVAANAQALIGRKIVVTSGTRTPTRQAMAMKTKISLGENLRRLYADKAAIGQVLQAFHQAKVAKQSPVDAMANTIASQIQNGVYLSNHLREGAVDVRTRDLSHAERQAVLQAVSMVPGVRASNEDTPPHFHLDIG